MIIYIFLHTADSTLRVFCNFQSCFSSFYYIATPFKKICHSDSSALIQFHSLLIIQKLMGLQSFHLQESVKSLSKIMAKLFQHSSVNFSLMAHYMQIMLHPVSGSIVFSTRHKADPGFNIRSFVWKPYFCHFNSIYTRTFCHIIRIYFSKAFILVCQFSRLSEFTHITGKNNIKVLFAVSDKLATVSHHICPVLVHTI